MFEASTLILPSWVLGAGRPAYPVQRQGEANQGSGPALQDRVACGGMPPYNPEHRLEVDGRLAVLAQVPVNQGCYPGTVAQPFTHHGADQRPEHSVMGLAMWAASLRPLFHPGRSGWSAPHQA